MYLSPGISGWRTELALWYYSIIGLGDGQQTEFSATISKAPLVRDTVVVSTIIDGEYIILIDLVWTFEGLLSLLFSDSSMENAIEASCELKISGKITFYD